MEEFERAYKEIKSDPTGAKAVVWSQILSKYHPTFITQCENAIIWSKSFVQDKLEKIMFKGEGDAAQKAKKITDTLSNFTENKTHSRHLHIHECKKLGLKISEFEEDSEFQDLILTVHHTYMHSLMNYPAYKIIENHNGVAFAKQQQQVIQPV